MAKTPREVLGAASDHMGDVAAFLGHAVDVTWRSVDRAASASIDKMYAGALLVQDVLFRPDTDTKNEDERNT